MKIHSSSLTFSPARLNPQHLAKNNNAQNDDKAAVNSAKETQPATRISPADKLLKASETTATNLNSDAYQPTDKRTLNALNAYQQEFNQSLQDRRVNSIASVDTYA